MPDTVGLEEHEPTSPQGIALRAQTCKDHRFRDLYRCLDGQLLHCCWRELNKRAASGVDEVTAQAYEQEVTANIGSLAERLKTKRYRTKLVRRCYIPKENGGERPLGIPALEDKLVQLACAKLLGAIMEIRKTGVYAKWLDGLRDIRARARVQVRVERLAAGNAGDVKPVGEKCLGAAG